MAQIGLCPNSESLTTGGRKLDTKNPVLIEPTSSMGTTNSISKDKFQCTFFRKSSPKNPEKRNSVPRLDTNNSSEITDPYSDSDSEAENIRNVARWLESLPTNQDWYEIEDDLISRQGDFQKESSIIENVPKNLKKDNFDTSNPSTSYKKDSPSSSWEAKGTKNKLSRTKGAKSKKSVGEIKSGKLKVHFKEIPTEIHSENSRYSKLLGQENQFQSSSESLEKSNNLRRMPISKSDSKELSSSDDNNEEKVETRKCSYNLRSLKTKKVEQFEARTSDSEEKIGRSRRSCSIRYQEYRRRSRGSPLVNSQEGRNNNQVEDSKPTRKLKSPFTKQAHGSRTPGLFTGISCLSPYEINEHKESNQNGQKQDREPGTQKSLDRKLIVRSKLAKNRKLLKTVKDLVNCMENNPDPIKKTYVLRKSHKSRNEEFKNQKSTTPIQSNEDLGMKMSIGKYLSRNKPKFSNSKLERRLDEAMELAMNRYKRSHGSQEAKLNEKNTDQLGEPPRKKKKPVF